MIIRPADFLASASSNASCSHSMSAAFRAWYSAGSPFKSPTDGSAAEPLLQRLLHVPCTLRVT
jgi:hypothetical protein